jgi:hypothetical protein
MMAQPEDILADSAKALEMRANPCDPGRFGEDDDTLDIGFWIRMVTIMRAELVKALKK